MTSASAQKHGHAFGEAFMLMWYSCECGHREQIWNSRDGVTPFALSCPKCGGMLSHVQWRNDIYAPNHKLQPGQRFWRDGTPDEAEAIMRRRIERMQEAFPCTPEQASELISQARGGTAHEFQAGWPMLDECSAAPAANSAQVEARIATLERALEVARGVIKFFADRGAIA